MNRKSIQLGFFIVALAASAAAQTTVTTTGGTANAVAKFSGASTVTNSVIVDTGSGVGVGRTPAANTMLDVNGSAIIRGASDISRTADATTSAGANSFPLIFSPEVWYSTSNSAIVPTFQWQAEVTGNNTASPSATLNLLSSNGITTSPSETGLSINQNGILTFAPGQTFPGTETTGSGGISGTAGYLPLFTGSATVGNSIMTQSGGNIGIGTTNPTAQLHIYGPGNQILTLQSATTGYPGISFGNPGFGYANNLDANNGSLYWFNGSSRNMTLLQNGYLGIGTTNPNNVLSVVGTGGTASAGPAVSLITATNNGGGGGYIWSQQILAPNALAGDYVDGVTAGVGNSSYNSGAMSFHYVGNGSPNNAISFGFFGVGEKMEISGNGNVGIGTPAPITALDVNNGMLHVAGNVTPATTTSSGAYIGWNALTGGTGETDFINNPATGSGGFSFMTVPSSGSPRTPILFINSNGAITFADKTVQSTAWTGILCGGDYAEAVDVQGDLKHYGPGDVLVIASGDGGDVEKASEPYSTKVVGIYATKPGVIGRRQELEGSPDTVPMAMVGIVPAKVSAENGPIHKGDLLVTASIPGYAMKGTDRSRMLGAVIGKALGSLDSGTGVIEAVVTLQ